MAQGWYYHGANALDIAWVPVPTCSHTWNETLSFSRPLRPDKGGDRAGSGSTGSKFLLYTEVCAEWM
jgi:hypothetical protein